MRIIWSDAHKRFELENCTYDEREFPGTAGWKFDGDTRSWWTMLPATVIALRGQKPPSGLSITQSAFGRITDQLDAPAKKARKAKKEPAQRGSKMARTIPEGLIVPPIPRFARPKPPELCCRICSEPVYFYETQNPPTCLWCEQQEVTNGVSTVS